MAAAAAGRDVNPAEAREKARAAAATSLSYLRKAAEKKKERDREFAVSRPPVSHILRVILCTADSSVHP